MPEYQLQETVKCEASFPEVPTTVSGYIITFGGATREITPQQGDTAKDYYAYYIPSGEGGHRYVFTAHTADVIYKESGTFTVVSFSPTDLDYLIGDLRLYLGDTDPDTYSYSRETLSDALILAIKALGRRWGRKYKVKPDGTINRNTKRHKYEDSLPPVIQFNDEPPIIVQAAIIIKSAELKDHTWDLQSWRDDEIQYSNLGAGRTARDDLERDKNLLDELLSGKLYGTSRQALPGFRAPLNVREGYK